MSTKGNICNDNANSSALSLNIGVKLKNSAGCRPIYHFDFKRDKAKTKNREKQAFCVIFLLSLVEGIQVPVGACLAKA